MKQTAEEDESDLIYEKQKKLLLQDHLLICKVLMGTAVFVMILQIAFAIWRLTILRRVENSGKCDKQKCTLMIIWLHYIKLGFNVICSFNYVINIRNNLSD